MSISWEKKGIVIRPDKNKPWMKTHSMLPTPFWINASVYRIYLGSRNNENQSHIGFVDIDMAEPDKILNMCDAPILTPGRLGTFDDNGVLPSCVVRNGDDIFLYYIGFKPGGTTRMDLFGGLCVSKDNGQTFERWSESPIIERNRVNPFINTAPWVMPHEEMGWVMYYVAGIEWVNADLPRYNIQIAFSCDGKEWNRAGQVAIDFVNNENALARPYVFRDEEGWHMWFSSKGPFYLPRYAHSNDGIRWTRVDGMADIQPSIEEFDKEMICYPVVLKYKEKYIMYYNGNAYGKEGVCLAVGTKR